MPYVVAVRGSEVVFSANVGESLPLVATVRDSGGALVDVSGWSSTLKAQYADVDGGTPVVSLSTPSTIANGGAAGTFTATVETDDIEADRPVLLTWRTVDGAGVVRDLCSGSLVCRKVVV